MERIEIADFDFRVTVTEDDGFNRQGSKAKRVYPCVKRKRGCDAIGVENRVDITGVRSLTLPTPGY